VRALLRAWGSLNPVDPVGRGDLEHSTLLYTLTSICTPFLLCPRHYACKENVKAGEGSLPNHGVVSAVIVIKGFQLNAHRTFINLVFDHTCIGCSTARVPFNAGPIFIWHWLLLQHLQAGKGKWWNKKGLKCVHSQATTWCVSWNMQEQQTHFLQGLLTMKEQIWRQSCKSPSHLTQQPLPP